MKNVILSFDYELFFGARSGSVLECLIKPTNALLDVMSAVGFKGNFFVDVLMIMALKRNSDQRSKDDLGMIENQLKDIVRRGHRIELHLHPHWLDAAYKGDGEWDFSNLTHYCLSSLHEDVITNLFIDGVSYLNAIARSVSSEYRVCVFRAGGWAVQPFDKLKKAFLKSGIKIDSSASYGIKNITGYSAYDFSKMPQKGRYRFEDAVVKEVAGGCFLEVPISNFKMSLAAGIIKKIVSKLHPVNLAHHADGTYAQGTPSKPVFRKSKLYYYTHLGEERNMLGFSMINPWFLSCVVKGMDGDLLCFIDHPKDFSDATCESIRTLKKSIGGGHSVLYVDLLQSI